MLDEIKQFLHPAAPLSPVREPAVSIDAKHPREQSLQLTPQHLVHELRQPLNIIVGSLQELRGQIDTAQSIQSLKHGYVLMGNIFTNMAQGGIVKLQKKPFTLRQLVDEIKDFQKLDSNVQITIDDASIREHLDISLYGDPGKLQQILLNLVSNAAKFCVDEDAVKRSGKDKPTVEISFECQQDDDDKLLILMSVKDYGPGIPKEARDKLFKPGSRLEQPKNAKDKSSSGIGLNVSHLLVQCMQQDGNLASRGIECESVHSGSPEAEDLTRPTWTKFSSGRLPLTMSMVVSPSMTARVRR
jgi:signal transduction histidine kinase